MRFFRTSFIAALAIVAFSSFAEAGISLRPSFHYSTSDFDLDLGAGGSTKSEEVNTLLSFGLYYHMPMGLYLGADYISTNTESKSNGTTSKTTIAAYGPTVGFFAANGFSLDLTYLIGPTVDLPTTPSSKGKDGSGIRFRVAYTHFFNDTVGIGPNISYSALNWDKVESGGAEIANSKFSLTNIDPYIDLWFMF